MALNWVKGDEGHCEELTLNAKLFIKLNWANPVTRCEGYWHVRS